MKKTTYLLGALSFFIIASVAHAQGFVPLAPIPDLTQGATTSQEGLANFLNNLYKYAIGLAAAIAVIQIVWAGLDIAIWHKDAVSTITNDKEKIYNALFGLVLVLSPVLVFSIINPSILNLSLNLPELKTTTVLPTGPSNGTGDSTAATAAGCSASRVVLGATDSSTVGCPTQQAAQNFAASCSNGPGQVYSTGDSSYPYGASCNTLPTGGVNSPQFHRDYTDKTKIPSTYWCYLTNIITNSSPVLTYICAADKNSCDALVINKAGGGSYAGDCRTAPF